MVKKSRSLRSVLVTSVAAATALASAAVGSPASAAPPPTAPSPGESRALAVDAAAELVADRAPALYASEGDAFIAKPVISVPEGLQYVPYERTHDGLPVIGGDFVVVTDAKGNVNTTSVAQTRPIGDLSLTPQVTTGQAAKAARGAVSSVTSVSKSRLVVHALGAPRLAWQTEVTGTKDGKPSKQTVYTDARTGATIETVERVMAGNGTAAYSGPNPVQLDTQQSGSTYYLRDPQQTTLQCQNSTGNTTFSGPDDNWGNGNATNRETGCVDGFFSQQTLKKMLQEWLGRSGMDGNGGWVPMRVGLNDQNAYYDGSQIQIGHNSAGGWISSMDVVAHEYGHGLDDHTPGGISRAGTQEFVGDTFGAAVEAYSNQGASYDPPDYLVGEEVNLVGQGPIRNMHNPGELGDPNCYSSSVPNMEVHAAAGPGNHWFYLASEGSNPGGGKPTSPTCNNSTVTGIGIQKVQKIMYNAMLMKTTSSSYLRYRTWTLTAAKNLFPGSCAEFNVVKAAWDAVSVPAQTGDPTCSDNPGGVTVNNPGNKTGTINTAITPFTITATGGTTPYTWSATGLPAGITIGSANGTVSGTPTAQGTFNVTVTATDSASPPKTGTTQFTFQIGQTGGCGTHEFTVTGTLASGARQYQPSGGYYESATSGAHRANLCGPSGTDFDVYLQKWNGFSWTNVASGTSPGNNETINYNGTAGRYRYQIHAYSGSGNYTLGYTNP